AAMPEVLPMGEGSGEPEVVQPQAERGAVNGTVAGAKTPPTKPAGGSGRGGRQAVRLLSPEETHTAVAPADDPADAERAGGWGGGGADLDAVAALFPPPPLLAAAGLEPVKVGFPVPVPLIRDVTRLKVDLSRQLGRRLSNHEIGAAATSLLPRRRLVADIPEGAATALEDLVLAVDATENVRVTKSQLWALAHVLLL